MGIAPIKNDRKFPTINFISLSLIMLTVFGGAYDFDIACGDDSVFGFMSGGNTIIENVLGATWGVGTAVTANFYPLATEFAGHALDFVNLVVDPEAGSSCNDEFSTWMHETFATKEETMTWIEQKADYVESQTFNLISSIEVNDVLQSMKLLDNAKVLYTEWVEGGRVEGGLDDTYQDRLDEARDTLHGCATKFLEAAGVQGSFESAKIAALAAGSRCAVYFYAILHLEYATAQNKNSGNQQVFINDLNMYKSTIDQWEDDFNSAVEAIKERRNDIDRLEYSGYQGSVEKRTSSSRSCSPGGLWYSDLYRWYAGSTQCIFTDRAFDPTGETTEVTSAGWAYKRSCDNDDFSDYIRNQACVVDTDPRWDIIKVKREALEEKLDQFHQRIFMIDFTKATDVISQMISGVEHGLMGDQYAHSTCALGKNKLCTGSTYSDVGFMDSASCMAECKGKSWCNCITMSKEFGCRLERGSVHSGTFNGYWALNRVDCEGCELEQGRYCSGSSWTDKPNIHDAEECMAECKKRSWCNCITMSTSIGCRLERGEVSGYGSGYSAMNRASCQGRRLLTDMETAFKELSPPPEKSEERGDVKM